MSIAGTTTSPASRLPHCPWDMDGSASSNDENIRRFAAFLPRWLVHTSFSSRSLPAPRCFRRRRPDATGTRYYPYSPVAAARHLRRAPTIRRSARPAPLVRVLATPAADMVNRPHRRGMGRSSASSGGRADAMAARRVSTPCPLLWAVHPRPAVGLERGGEQFVQQSAPRPASRSRGELPAPGRLRDVLGSQAAAARVYLRRIDRGLAGREARARTPGATAREHRPATVNPQVNGLHTSQARHRRHDEIRTLSCECPNVGRAGLEPATEGL
jgi:hypothetical protein